MPMSSEDATYLFASVDRTVVQKELLTSMKANLLHIGVLRINLVKPDKNI